MIRIVKNTNKVKIKGIAVGEPIIIITRAIDRLLNQKELIIEPYAITEANYRLYKSIPDDAKANYSNLFMGIDGLSPIVVDYSDNIASSWSLQNDKIIDVLKSKFGFIDNDIEKIENLI